MRLLSVNVSMPQIIEEGNRQIRTGIFKKPVEGLIKVGNLNLEGDGQADLSVHGGPDKAVYVYSWKNVESWRRELGRDDLGPGSFGENLTVDDMADTAIAIGDELEIGTARFVVTQPRLPCYKLGLALRMPEFPKMFKYSGRNGFYLRVLREGTLRAGDAVRKMDCPDGDCMTVAEFTAIVTKHTVTPRDFERIRKLTALPNSWKRRLEEELRERAT